MQKSDKVCARVSLAILECCLKITLSKTIFWTQYSSVKMVTRVFIKLLIKLEFYLEVLKWK